MTRPNTKLQNDVTSERTLLCAGEDFDELLTSLGAALPAAPQSEHRYRCYRLLRYEKFTLIWTGIGTGCLEPLLCELLPLGIVRRIVLVGTAGMTRPGILPMSRAHYVARAYLGATAIRGHDDEPQLPSLANHLALPEAASVSTDFYYGFSANTEDPLTSSLHRHDAQLAESVRRNFARAEVVDMESAQFYWLCRAIGDRSLEFAAVKAASNNVADWDAQTINTPGALTSAVSAALRLLEIA